MENSIESELSQNIIDRLHDAAEQRNWELCKQVLHEATTVSISSEDCDILLHFAAFVGDKDTVNLLINRGADVNFKSGDGITALHIASTPFNNGIVHMLPFGFEKDVLSFKSYKPRTDNYLTHRSPYQYVYRRELNQFHGLCECYYIGCTNFLIQKIIPAKLNNTVVNEDTSVSPFTFQSESSESNIEIIELLISSGADINASLTNGKTPLHVAVESGRIEHVKTLLKYKPNVNCPCCGGHTPLHIAAKGNKKEIIEMLINSGADIDASISSGMTPLHLAVETGFLNNVETLLRLKLNVNKTCTFENNNGYTPLHFAAKGSNEEVLKILLNLGVDINVSTEVGLTPLHLAVKYGQVSNVRIILKYNPDVNCTCTIGKEGGYTPLHFASMYSSGEMVQVLLCYGADITARTKTGKTPLILAAENNRVNNVKLLLKHNPEVNYFCTSEDGGGYTALHYAAKGTDEEIVAILLNSGADVNAQATDGRTPLHVAVASNNEDSVKHILTHKADVNIPCVLGVEEGYTPLHFAARQSSERIVEMLLNAGALVNAVTKHGKTPLHLAVEYSLINNVKMLIRHKADVNYSSASGDDEGYTRFVLDSEELRKAVKEKLLQNQNDYCNMHFFPKQLITDSDSFNVVIKYKPVVNCKCNASKMEDALPIHFAVKGCTDNISIILRARSKIYNAMSELYRSFSSLSNGYKDQSCKGCICKYVPDRCCSCSSSYSEGYTPLHYASKGSNAEITEILLNHGGDVNACTINGETALYLAVECSRIANVNVLLKYKPDLNLPCNLGYNSGYTPLHCAAARPDKNILEVLLNNGADTNTSTSNGVSPLFPAVKLGLLDNINVFFKYKLDLNNETHKLSFLFAVTKANKKISNAFKNYGFRINDKDVDNVEVLHQSIVKKHFNICDDFLKFAVDVNIVTNSGVPVLHVACETNNDRMVRGLLKQNVNVNCLDKQGNTALHVLTRSHNVELMSVLLEYGADVNIKNTSGYTALTLACEKYTHGNLKTEQCIMTLLQYKADINSRTNCAENPLCYLISKENSFNLVKMFLELGADVNIKGRGGCTPLHVACRKCDNEDNQPTKYIDLLFRYGADVNATGEANYTALHDVCYNYLNPSIINHAVDERIVTIIEHGADLSIETYYKQTPVQLYLKCYIQYRSRNRNIPDKFIHTTLFFIEQLVMRNLSERGLFLIEKVFTENYLFSEEVRPLCTKLRTHLSKCEEEISNLKNEYICEMNVYDILTGLAKCAAGCDINKIIEAGIKEKYPVYFNRIINNLKKAKERIELLKFIKVCLNSLHPNKLPDRAVELIIGNLSERDYRIFSLCMNA